MNGTLMCLVGLLHLLQVRPIFTLHKAPPPPYRHPHHHSRRAHRHGASKQPAPSGRTARNTSQFNGLLIISNKKLRGKRFSWSNSN